MLTETQNRFLVRYANFKGDAYKALDSLGLEVNHLMNWRMNKNFDLEYRKKSQEVLSFLNQENYMNGVRQLNTILINGIVQESISYKKEIDAEGNEKYITTKTEKRLGVPLEAIKLAISHDDIIRAVNTLQNQGILPNEISNNILIHSEEIAAKMRSSFDTENDGDKLDDERVVNLLKSAVLGVVNDN